MFRVRSARLKLHPLEKALLIVVAAHLCFLPWALGTMHVWSQITSAVLAVTGFIISLCPRQYTEEFAREGQFKLIMWPKLVRSPAFWLGLGFLGYVLLQAMNPAWVYMSNDRVWWLKRINNIDWLPSGMETPFKDMNAWRMLMIYGSAWLVVCSIWVGFTRRVTVQNLIGALAVNGALLALVGILQRMMDAQKILWLIDAPASYFVSTIIYKNHAGAYFNLVLTLSAALMYLLFVRGERKMERSNPAPLFAFCGVLLAMVVLVSYSRAATILMLGFMVVGFAGFMIRLIFFKGEGRSPFAIGLLVVVFALFSGLGAWYLNVNTTADRIERLFGADRAASITSRQTATQATWEMAQDKLITGWGAGSFRHYFPVYQQKHPEIYKQPNGRVLRWEFAHNDYVQLLAELGLVGVGFVVAMLGVWIVRLTRNGIWHQPHALVLLLGLVMTMIHCYVDFNSHCPAILLTWCASAALLARWTELESGRDMGK